MGVCVSPLLCSFCKRSVRCMVKQYKEPQLSDLPYALSSASERDVGQNLSQGSYSTMVGWTVEKCLTHDQLVEHVCSGQANCVVGALVPTKVLMSRGPPAS